MFLFKSKGSDSKRSQLLERWAALWLRKQRQCSDWLGRRFSALPLLYKRSAVVLFCLLSGCTCLYIAVETIRSSSHANGKTFVQRSPPPLHIGRNFDKLIYSSKDTAIFHRIEQTLDSLARHDSISYHRLMNARPRLRDSIAAFKGIILSNQQKK